MYLSKQELIDSMKRIIPDDSFVELSLEIERPIDYNSLPGEKPGSVIVPACKSKGLINISYTYDI